METYKHRTIIVRVTDVIPPMLGNKFCGQVERVYNLQTEQDEHLEGLYIHHTKTRQEAEDLAIQEAKEWIDKHV